jgi:serine/threonine protein kinase
MPDEIQESSSQATSSDNQVSEQSHVHEVPRYTNEDVNRIVAKAKREEREKVGKVVQQSHSTQDLDRIVDERVNARIEREKRANFEMNLSAKLLSKIPEGEEKYKDFSKVIDSFSTQEDLPLLNEIAGHDNSIDLLYELGKHPTRADSFNRGLMSSNPTKRAQTAQELREYAKKIAAKQPAVKEPIEPPAPGSRQKNSANVQTSTDDSGDDVTEYWKNRSRSRY